MDDGSCFWLPSQFPKEVFYVSIVYIITSYKKAFNSLSSWTGELSCAQDAMAVPYIGKTLVQRFENKMQEAGLLPAPSEEPIVQLEQQTLKPTKKQKQYVPTYRSGAYAILLALVEGHESMSKSEIIKYGQSYCDSSFTIPESNRTQYSYTAWNSIKVLIQKELVENKKRFARKQRHNKKR